MFSGEQASEHQMLLTTDSAAAAADSLAANH